jgi:hypothetical protein
MSQTNPPCRKRKPLALSALRFWPLVASLALHLPLLWSGHGLGLEGRGPRVEAQHTLIAMDVVRSATPPPAVPRVAAPAPRLAGEIERGRAPPPARATRLARPARQRGGAGAAFAAPSPSTAVGGRRESPPGPGAGLAAARPEEALTGDSPFATVPPRGLQLFPPSVIPDASTIRRGQTLTPAGVLDPSERLAAAAARGRERVDGWVRGELASARVTSGLVDPLVLALGEALEAELGHSDGGAPAELGVTDANAGFKKSYLQGAESYARTGNPGTHPPNARELLPSEKLANLDAPLLLRAAAQAKETASALAELTPFLALRLEVKQAPSGALLSAEVVEASGNSLFDAFVLRTLPPALETLASQRRTT